MLLAKRLSAAKPEKRQKEKVPCWRRRYFCPTRVAMWGSPVTFPLQLQGGHVVVGVVDVVTKVVLEVLMSQPQLAQSRLAPTTQQGGSMGDITGTVFAFPAGQGEKGPPTGGQPAPLLGWHVQLPPADVTILMTLHVSGPSQTKSTCPPAMNTSRDSQARRGGTGPG